MHIQENIGNIMFIGCKGYKIISYTPGEVSVIMAMDSSGITKQISGRSLTVEPKRSKFQSQYNAKKEAAKELKKFAEIKKMYEKQSSIKRDTDSDDQARYDKGYESVLGHYEGLVDDIEYWAKENKLQASGYLRAGGSLNYPEAYMDVDLSGKGTNLNITLNSSDTLTIKGTLKGRKLNIIENSFDPYSSRDFWAIVD